MAKQYRSRLRPANVPVTLRQLTNAPYTQERGDDSGVLTCKAVKPYYEYDSNAGKFSNHQIGWSYQCTVEEQNSATVFVKVNDMNRAVTDEELSQGPVALTFADFKGTWWIDKNGDLQLSCKAVVAERT